jgi:ankyrin repeat protein
MKSFMNRSRQFFPALGLMVICLFGIPGMASAGDVDALYRAAGDGNSTKVAALLEDGVDVDGRTRSGSYALNAAAVENEVEVMRILIDHGANPNVQNSQGDTPLICATKYAGGKSTTVELLVNAGSDRGIRDNKGKTALDYAKAKGQQEAIALLEKASN